MNLMVLKRKGRRVVNKDIYCQHLTDTRLVNDNLCRSLSGLRSISLNLLDNVKALDNRSKHNVLAIQPFGRSRAQEELGSVGSWSGVGHGQDSWSSVLQGEVLIGKLLAIDTLSSGSV